MKIAVTGATGRVGHHAVDLLEARGHDVVPISRAKGVDVLTGAGLTDALAGVECVIDTATGSSPDQREATEWFMTAARNLLEACERAGVQRIVEVSIIGVDKATAGYGAAKLAQEQAIQAGPIPVQILRASQFHEFVPQVIEWGTQGDVAYLQQMRVQPVAAHAVAEALVDLATDPAPTGTPIAEIAGPQEEQFVDMAKRLVARRGDPLRIEGGSNPAFPDRELHENGGLLPNPHAKLAGPTFDEWLDSAMTVTTK